MKQPRQLGVSLGMQTIAYAKRAGRGTHFVHMSRVEKPVLALALWQPVVHDPLQSPGSLPPRTQSKAGPNWMVYCRVAVRTCGQWNRLMLSLRSVARLTPFSRVMFRGGKQRKHQDMHAAILPTCASRQHGRILDRILCIDDVCGAWCVHLLCELNNVSVPGQALAALAA
jgi:hypothetical protein